MNDFPLLTELRILYNAEGEEAVEALVETWSEEKRDALIQEIMEVEGARTTLITFILPGIQNNPYWS